MTQPQAQCGACDRYRSPFSAENTTGLEGPFCAAFPTGIPDVIYTNQVDHRQPFDGDHDLQWIPRAGAVFPTYAFLPGVLSTVVAAAAPAVSGATNTGAMIALVPAEVDALDLAVEGGEPAEELHCTLLFLGEASGLDEAYRQDVIDQVRAVAAGWDPFEADAFCVSMFNPAGDDPCVVLGLSGVELADVFDQVEELVTVKVEQHPIWTPHITLAYTDDPGLVAEVTDRCGTVLFDRLRVAYGDQITDIPLGGEEEDHPEPVAAEVEPVVAAREVWDGCPYCFRPAHNGPCGLPDPQGL